jgi:hypothetical protein
MSRAKQQCSAAEARLRIEQRLLDLTLQELCCVQAMIGGDASLELPAELSKVRADIRRERHNSTMLTEMTTQRTRTEAEQRALFGTFDFTVVIYILKISSSLCNQQWFVRKSRTPKLSMPKT